MIKKTDWFDEVRDLNRSGMSRDRIYRETGLTPVQVRIALQGVSSDEGIKAREERLFEEYGIRVTRVDGRYCGQTGGATVAVKVSLPLVSIMRAPA